MKKAIIFIATLLTSVHVLSVSEFYTNPSEEHPRPIITGGKGGFPILRPRVIETPITDADYKMISCENYLGYSSNKTEA